MSPRRRQVLLASILRGRPLLTQEQIAAALASAGAPVTQATVSRDLAAIGAVRGHGGYLLPASPDGPAEEKRLAKAIRDHVVQIDEAAALVVVRTAPGHAGVLAAALDASPPDGMVGCVSGDDTILIATPSTRAAGSLASALRDILEQA